MQSDATITELVLLDGKPAAWILCPGKMIPAPGQYLLAHADDSDSPPALRSSALAVPVFAAKIFTGSHAGLDGFLAAPPAPPLWLPGARLRLRGPLGHGFILPASARRVALIAFGDSAARLMPLIEFALKQQAALVLVCETPPDDLPLQVEVQPLRALADVWQWADYAALDAGREARPGLREILWKSNPAGARREAQILIRAEMPCGGLAQCGVCAVETRRGRLLACEDGPVFDLKRLLE